MVSEIPSTACDDVLRQDSSMVLIGAQKLTCDLEVYESYESMVTSQEEFGLQRDVPNLIVLFSILLTTHNDDEKNATSS